MKKFFWTIIFVIFTSSVYAQGLSMSTGVLDYSDDKKKASFVEATFSFSENISFNTPIGNFVPMTGAMLTEDNAAMLYAGIKTEYKIGN